MANLQSPENFVREITLAYWTAGHFAGGPEIFGGGEHMWSAEAVEPSEILHLSGSTLRALMQTIPALAIGLIEALVYKGKCYSALLQLLGTRSVTKRPAHLICTLAERARSRQAETIVMDMFFTNEELANMIGATRQWVSLTLRRFESEGVILASRPASAGTQKSPTPAPGAAKPDGGWELDIAFAVGSARHRLDIETRDDIIIGFHKTLYSRNAVNGIAAGSTVEFSSLHKFEGTSLAYRFMGEIDAGANEMSGSVELGSTGQSAPGPLNMKEHGKATWRAKRAT